MITIFTPTYNRANLLPRLFSSLMSQTSANFEWLIVDDGSSDNTAEVVRQMQASNPPFAIRYHKKPNGGKHTAINVGVALAKGELFFIVDSDDMLTPDAVEWIGQQYAAVKDMPEIAGIVGQRIYPDGKVNGQEKIDGYLDIDTLTLRYKMNGAGDHAEVFRTSVLKEYPFPEVEEERFVAESVVWNRIAVKYKLRYTSHPIYVCEYLADGLTSNILRHWIRSPRLSMIASLQTASLAAVPTKERIKAISNYWRYFFFSGTPFGKALREAGLKSIPFIPLGWLLYLRSRKLR